MIPQWMWRASAKWYLTKRNRNTWKISPSATFSITKLTWNPREWTPASTLRTWCLNTWAIARPVENTQALLYTSCRAVRYWITFWCIAMWKSVNPHFLCNVTIKMDTWKWTDCDPSRFSYRRADIREVTSLCTYSENIFAHSDRRFMSATDLQVSCQLYHLNHSLSLWKPRKTMQIINKTK